jgi:hypothetical protein
VPSKAPAGFRAAKALSIPRESELDFRITDPWRRFIG